eukprot:COSAG04_NODE_307_length_17238_cov_17.860260_11_plen_216_part_00
MAVGAPRPSRRRNSPGAGAQSGWSESMLAPRGGRPGPPRNGRETGASVGGSSRDVNALKPAFCSSAAKLGTFTRHLSDEAITRPLRSRAPSRGASTLPDHSGWAPAPGERRRLRGSVYSPISESAAGAISSVTRRLSCRVETCRVHVLALTLARELRESCARVARELRESCAGVAQELSKSKSCARVAQELSKSKPRSWGGGGAKEEANNTTPLR